MEKSCKKMSEHRKGENNGMYGKKHSPESIEKMRESARRRWANKKKQLTA